MDTKTSLSTPDSESLTPTRDSESRPSTPNSESRPSTPDTEPLSQASSDSSSENLDPSSEDPFDDERRCPSHPQHRQWWREACTGYALHLYYWNGPKLDTVMVSEDGKENSPSLYHLACEKFRKEAFVAAWIRAHEWCVSSDPATPWDNNLYDEALRILHLDEAGIKQLAGYHH